jgi:hypothetical protein
MAEKMVATKAGK